MVKAENSGGMQFYLDDILYEGPEIWIPDRSALHLFKGNSSGMTATVMIPVDVSTQAAPLPTAQDLEVKEVASGLKVVSVSPDVFAGASRARSHKP